LELQRGSKTRELRKQNVIELSVKNFFKSKSEVRVSGKKPRYQRFEVSEGIKSRRIEKIECD
jgi:hypothetical protein